MAFEWDGESGDHADIYITMLGSSEVRRLTTDPGGNRAPDGRPTVVRSPTSATTPIGRPDSPGVVPWGFRSGAERLPRDAPLAWSADGRYLAAQRAGESTGIVLIPIDGGEPRRLVQSLPAHTDSAPAFSPDGGRLASRSCATPMYGCDVSLIELDRTLVATSPPRRLTPSSVPLIGSLAWTRDGRSVIYNSLDP